jgi:cation-transporting ATPase 13A1
LSPELLLICSVLVCVGLLSAYAMSVLYLDGVKMGDTQMTFAGLSIAMFFLFISRSKPLDRLSAERPQSRLFTAHMMLSIVGQFALHMLTLLTAVQLSVPHTPQDAETKSTESTFKPNVLNTVVYLVSTISTTATFLANYRGRPFMQGLRENVWLWRALLLNVAVVLLLASGLLPDFNELMQLVEMPSAVMRMQLMGLVIFDLLATIAYANALNRIFAIKPKKSAGSPAIGAAARLKAE